MDFLKKLATCFGCTCVTVLALLIPSSARAQNILNSRLDFKADDALPKCNQALSFIGLIARWIPAEVFDPPYARDLVVRIQRDPITRVKIVDVTIRDLSGVTLATLHKVWASDEECFFVVHETASDTARLMSVLDAKEGGAPDVSAAATNPVPVTDRPKSSDSPKSSEQQRPPPAAVPILAPPRPQRWFAGAGLTFQNGITPEWAPGPKIIGGLVPFEKYPRFKFELDFAMPMLLATRPGGETNLQVFAPSLLVAPCYVRRPLRFCALGLSGVLIAQGDEQLDFVDRSVGLLYGLGLRAGAELQGAGAFSLRIDGDASWFGRFALTGGRYHTLWTPRPLNLAFNVTAVWAF